MGYSKSDPRHPMNSEGTTSNPDGLKPKKKRKHQKQNTLTVERK